MNCVWAPLGLGWEEGLWWGEECVQVCAGVCGYRPVQVCAGTGVCRCVWVRVCAAARQVMQEVSYASPPLLTLRTSVFPSAELKGPSRSGQLTSDPQRRNT